VGYFFLFLAFASVIVLSNNLVQGRFDQMPYGLMVLGLFSFLASRSFRKAKLKSSQPVAAKAQAAQNHRAQGARQSPQAKKPVVSSANQELAKRVSARLRDLAITYEDLRKPNLLVISEGWMERRTEQRTTRGQARLFINRDGFVIQYLNQNSRTGKNQFIKKNWNQILGCLPTEYTYWFADGTSVTFHPTQLEDKIFLSAAWGCLEDAMNGSGYLFTDLQMSGIGERLRDAARYVDENQNEVVRAGKVDMDAVPKLEVALEKGVKKDPAWEYGRHITWLPKPPKEGDEFSGFKLIKQLGAKSGQGLVFRAKHKDHQSEVCVVKVMQQKNFGSVGDPAFHDSAARFLDEAKLSSNYSHIPFLVTASDWSEDPWPAIVYPLVEGETVTDRVKRGAIVESDWWNLAHDTLSALYFLHRDGMIHQDIKPDNIMITERKSVILDFGLAYVTGYQGSSTSYGGTVPFMSPEMLMRKTAEDSKNLTPAADMYAIGLVLYWAGTGDYGWLPQRISAEQELSFDALVESHRTFQLRPERFAPDELDLVSSLLRFNPAERISARQALEIVASHVDIEQKTMQFEELVLAAMSHKGEEPVPVDEKVTRSSVKGPFTSWAKFEETIATIYVNRRPRIAVIELDFNKRESLYCQMYREEPGWSVECMSDTFTDLEQSRKVRTTFIDLGWIPPSGSSPNYQRYVLLDESPKLPHLLTDAMAIGYGIDPTEIKRIKLTFMGENYDGKSKK
jgi:serine/threonine protein kinase